MKIKEVLLKVGKMRKPDICIVYQTNDLNDVIVQGERLIMRCDLLSGKALANYRCSGHNGIHQLYSSSAVSVTLTKDQIEQIMACLPASGDNVGYKVVSKA